MTLTKKERIVLAVVLSAAALGAIIFGIIKLTEKEEVVQQPGKEPEIRD